ncbi:GNAT family N-acetyltransferase [Amycolatopsis regifaucium]|uniref:Acetyltransferase n=1 Tax=Amycolatopsis regifaucium TaxID=546365 RepID=A0A154MAR0_9PSEU|nr:GNAT family N-acetyltransferase [Amycolatopsis regifaucium]KZB81433.1 acetyltransferase [Amycolatopsis regifaucium]OKA04698.1 GNAT family N-acetyltransferase [Amycolatopsis regifaucium]SFH31515.1 L-amino acid N-acyltransferase YncA [Amycolatopsis regifaucium]
MAAIRPATVEDAWPIAEVNVRSWQSAYQGLLPEVYLRDLSVEGRAARWQRILADPANQGDILVLVEDGALLGFTAVDRIRGELRAIYLAPERWGTGLGRLLHDTAVAALRDAGHREATLWVLDSNERAQRFYAAAGWVPDGAQKSDTMPGEDVLLSETRYRIDLVTG